MPIKHFRFFYHCNPRLSSSLRVPCCHLLANNRRRSLWRRVLVKRRYAEPAGGDVNTMLVVADWLVITGAILDGRCGTVPGAQASTVPDQYVLRHIAWRIAGSVARSNDAEERGLRCVADEIERCVGQRLRRARNDTASTLSSLSNPSRGRKARFCASLRGRLARYDAEPIPNM